MTILSSAELHFAAAPRLTRVVGPWLLMAATIGVALLLRQVVAANTDVSLLLVSVERMLDGWRLYTEILEVNPPIAAWAYMPGVSIGRATGVRPETVIDLYVLALAAASVGAAFGILRRAASVGAASPWLAAWILAVLTILPMHVYGQREHFALIFFLPAVAAYALRANRDPLPVWGILVAGIGSAVTLMFKPHFVAAAICCVVAAAIRSRSWRVLVAPENVLSAAIVVAYGVLIAVVFPDYFTVINSLGRDVYLGLTVSLSILLTGQATALLFCAFVSIAILQRSKRPDSVLLMTMAASAGFALAFYLQQKGWAYHALPAVTFALIALGYAVAVHPRATSMDRRRVLAFALVMATLFAGGSLWFNTTFNVREIDATVAQIKRHPNILVLSGEAVIGYPLVRNLNGVWVSRRLHFWVREFIRRIRQNGNVDPQTDARLDVYLARERQELIEDFKVRPPDVILVDNLTSDWGAWAQADPEIAALLKPYTRSQTVKQIDILSRPDDQRG